MAEEIITDHLEKDIVPIFLPEKSLIKYGMKLSEDIGHSVPRYSFKTKQIQEEITSLGFMCDFHAVRDRVSAWPFETILVIKDDEGVYGENYYWAASDELVQRLNRVAPGPEGEIIEPQESEQERELRQAREEEERHAEINLLSYTEPSWIPRPWLSLGSDAEIDAERLDARGEPPIISFQFLRPRKHFGSRCQFDNIDVKDSLLISCNRQIDKSYDLRRPCLEGGFQAATGCVDVAVQTSNYRLVNKTTLYRPIEMGEAERVSAMESSTLATMIRGIAPTLQTAIEQNLAVNIFRNELDVLDQQELALGSKSDNARFFNTFVDLMYSKNRRITAIDWDRTRPGAIAVSCSQCRTSDERIEVSGSPQPSSVLIWNFNDLIHPEMILEAPDEVFTFRTNPQAPHLVVGGLANGQLILWNTNHRRYVIKVTDSSQRDNDLDNPDNTSSPTLVHVDPHMISYTERSHSRAVQDLSWLLPSLEVHKRGDLTSTCSEPHGVQIASLAGDGNLLFWDIRDELANPDQQQQQQQQHTMDLGESDFRWIPVFTLPIGAFKPTKMQMWNDSKSSAIFGNEAGVIGLGTWLPNRDSPSITDDLATDQSSSSSSSSSNLIVATVDAHILSCSSIEVSPHFPDLVLTVGDWSFSIIRIVDKNKLQKIFNSGCANDYLTDAVWCPNRPGVIVTSKANGSLDIWDLCDQSHKPATCDMMVSSTGICCIQLRPTCYPIAASQHGLIPYLAVGDSSGNLHIVQLPSNFTTPIPNEQKTMEAFYQREGRRFEYFEMLHKKEYAESKKKGAVIDVKRSS